MFDNAKSGGSAVSWKQAGRWAGIEKEVEKGRASSPVEQKKVATVIGGGLQLYGESWGITWQDRWVVVAGRREVGA